MKKIIRILLLLSGIVILISYINSLNKTLLNNYFFQADKIKIFFGTIFFFIFFLLKGYKWFIMLKHCGLNISFKKFIFEYFFIFVLGWFTPLRSGETLASFHFKSNYNINLDKSLSLILFDKVLELSTLILIIILSTLFFLSQISISSYYSKIIFGSVVFLIFVFVLFILSITSKKFILFIISLIHSNFSSLSRQFDFSVEDYFKFFNLWKNKFLIKLLSLTFLMWFVHSLFYFFVFSSISVIDYFKITSVQFIASAIALASLIPSGVGIFTISTSYLLSFFNISKEHTTVASLMIHFFGQGIFVIFALIIYIIKSVHIFFIGAKTNE